MTKAVRNLLLIIAAVVTIGIVLTQVTYIPKSSAAEFGVGVVECAATVGPVSADVKILESNGWKMRDTFKDAKRYQRSDVNVRLIIKSGISGCLTQGVAENEGQFSAISNAVSGALKAKYGSQLKIQNAGNSGQQVYQTGSLVHILYEVKTPDGPLIRIVSIWDRNQKQ